MNRILNKLFVIVMLFLFIIPLAFALDYSFVFKAEQDVDLNIPVFDENLNRVDNTYTCNINIEDSNSNTFINNQNMSYVSDGVFEYTINSTQIANSGLYYGIVTCSDGVITGLSTFSIFVTPSGKDPLATGFGTTIAIMIFYSLLIILLGLATWYFDNGLKFFFLLLTMLMILVGMNIAANVTGDFSSSIAGLLWVVYKASVFVFMFLFFVVLVKLIGELKLRRNAMNTDNLDSPGDDYKRNFR